MRHDLPPKPKRLGSATSLKCRSAVRMLVPASAPGCGVNELQRRVIARPGPCSNESAS